MNFRKSTRTQEEYEHPGRHTIPIVLYLTMRQPFPHPSSRSRWNLPDSNQPIFSTVSPSLTTQQPAMFPSGLRLSFPTTPYFVASLPPYKIAISSAPLSFNSSFQTQPSSFHAILSCLVGELKLLSSTSSSHPTHRTPSQKWQSAKKVLL